ncbi:MAG: hypothetical protein ACYDBQ_05995 [Thermoplasmatota archaeon]
MQTKPAINPPDGYGPLPETMEAKDVAGLEGTLSIHSRPAGQPGRVATLRLHSNSRQVSFKHLWEPKTQKRSHAGSLLLFRNPPNSQRSENWTSVDYRRRVEVHQGPN